MLNQNQTEFSHTFAADTGAFASNSTDGREVSKIIGAEGEKDKNVEAGVSLTLAQNQQNGAGDAPTEENLYECHHLTNGAGVAGDSAENRKGSRSDEQRKIPAPTRPIFTSRIRKRKKIFCTKNACANLKRNQARNSAQIWMTTWAN